MARTKFLLSTEQAFIRGLVSSKEAVNTNTETFKNLFNIVNETFFRNDVFYGLGFAVNTKGIDYEKTKFILETLTKRGRNTSIGWGRLEDTYEFVLDMAEKEGLDFFRKNVIPNFIGAPYMTNSAEKSIKQALEKGSKIKKAAVMELARKNIDFVLETVTEYLEKASYEDIKDLLGGKFENELALNVHLRNRNKKDLIEKMKAYAEKGEISKHVNADDKQETKKRRM